jgi:hypothetical protein
VAYVLMGTGEPHNHLARRSPSPGWTSSHTAPYLVISSVISCLGEMTALMPVNAPVMEFPRRFMSRSVGFAVGWVYW